MNVLFIRWSLTALFGLVLPMVAISMLAILVGLNSPVGTFDPAFQRPAGMPADTTILTSNQAGHVTVNAYG